MSEFLKIFKIFLSLHPLKYLLGEAKFVEKNTLSTHISMFKKLLPQNKTLKHVNAHIEMNNYTLPLLLEN